MTRLLMEFVGRNSKFRCSLIINGHAHFSLVTLVCSTPTEKTIFYIDAANINDASLTSKVNKLAREFLAELGIIPEFLVTDGLQFELDEGRVLDLHHLTTAFFKLLRADYIHTEKHILFFSRDVLAAAISSERCKPLVKLMEDNAKVSHATFGRGASRIDPSVFNAVHERDLLMKCAATCFLKFSRPFAPKLWVQKGHLKTGLPFGFI